jgi:hypothetical protein
MVSRAFVGLHTHSPTPNVNTPGGWTKAIQLAVEKEWHHLHGALHSFRSARFRILPAEPGVQAFPAPGSPLSLTR